MPSRCTYNLCVCVCVCVFGGKAHQLALAGWLNPSRLSRDGLHAVDAADALPSLFSFSVEDSSTVATSLEGSVSFSRLGPHTARNTGMRTKPCSPPTMKMPKNI
mmetsp:Transcript_43619/g.98263  ORF Transcript_43619/g.98263 Transcript_43619/m.98263 type:complete len:104 (-) Transcript_43619:396-707(-)